MEKLIEQMQMDMTLQLFSNATIKSYMRHVKHFTDYFGQSIEELKEDDLRKYLYHIKVDKNYSSSSLSQAFSAIKFLYRETLKMPLSLTKLRGPKQVRRLPIVLSSYEVKKILDSAENPKHRLILMTTYSAGLRVSETAHLTINDIDSSRMQIRVTQGKGKKDRYTLLSAPLLDKLRDYWRVYRPAIWLFPGKLPCQPVAVSTIQRIFQRAKKKPGSINLPRPIPSAIVLLPTF